MSCGEHVELDDEWRVFGSVVGNPNPALAVADGDGRSV
jgi:hypothetical protein